MSAIEDDDLRTEVALLRELLQSQVRENDVLRNLLSDRARPAGAVAPRPPIGSRERMAMLEHAVDVLDGCVSGIAHWDCYSDRGENCTCAVCRAEHALAEVKNWRYGGSPATPSRRFVGSMNHRTTDGWNPREAKIHGTWAKFMESHSADRMLGMILTDRAPDGRSGFGIFDGPIDWPGPREWYVATSVVQWLATNVGSSILEGAGWKYTQWDEDRVAVDQLREARA